MFLYIINIQLVLFAEDDTGKYWQGHSKVSHLIPTWPRLFSASKNQGGSIRPPPGPSRVKKSFNMLYTSNGTLITSSIVPN